MCISLVHLYSDKLGYVSLSKTLGKQYILSIHQDLEAAVSEQLIQHLEHWQRHAIDPAVVAQYLQHDLAEHFSGMFVIGQTAEVLKQCSC